ncbi:MAG: hypothetical protein QM809_02955 [Gordonia sp. (in: high G+C Gram-positive bacteria)]|uniref:hypothetical protein n=1 Tax=Gordonia sp. (in: high G+C Gram-positive bacteria) TaxID=84139 RepID=UPI0039E6BB9B
MTDPGTRGHDDERIPTQAELDAEDLAEIERSRNRRPAYLPRPQEDPGPPPAALTRDAVLCWYVSAVAALVAVGYGLATLGATGERLRARWEPELAEANRLPGASSAESMASFWPSTLLIGWLVTMALSYPLLIVIDRRHSRQARTVYVSFGVMIVLFAPFIWDLLFDHPEVPAVFGVAVWVSAGALVASLLMTLRGVVGAWLPPSTRLRPSKAFRDARND